MQPNRPLGYVDNRVFAFVPEQGTWLHLNPVGGVLPVHEDARYTILRYGNVHYLPGFGEALTKAAQVWIRTYGGSTGSWPPEREARRIVIHGVGTRLARVIFWEHVRQYSACNICRTKPPSRMASCPENLLCGSTKGPTSNLSSTTLSSGVSHLRRRSNFGTSTRPLGRPLPERRTAHLLPGTARSASERLRRVLPRVSDGKLRN